MTKLDEKSIKEKIIKKYYNDGKVDPNLGKKILLINARESSKNEFTCLGFREEVYSVQIHS